jgi:hypothetical protein
MRLLVLKPIIGFKISPIPIPIHSYNLKGIASPIPILLSEK